MFIINIFIYIRFFLLNISVNRYQFIRLNKLKYEDKQIRFVFTQKNDLFESFVIISLFR